MAVGHDVSTRNPTTDITGFNTTTGNKTFTHAATANAKAAVVTVFSDTNANGAVGVLYGGTAMGDSGSGFLANVAAIDATETGTVQIFVLTGLVSLALTGSQTVTLQTPTAGQNMWATCTTITAATPDLMIAGTGKVDTSTGSSFSVTYNISGNSGVPFNVSGVHTGYADPASIGIGGNTATGSGDYGTRSAKAGYIVGASTTAQTVQWSGAVSDDWCIASVSLAEPSSPAIGRSRITSGLIMRGRR